MVTGGTDLATVKEILEHASIETTMRYAHPTTEGKMNADNALEKQIRGHEKDTSPKVT